MEMEQIIKTLRNYDFKILDYALDAGRSESQKAIAFFKEQNPHTEITNTVIVDIIRFLNCVYKGKLQTNAVWSDSSIILDGSIITCKLEGHDIESKVNITNSAISIEVKTDIDLTKTLTDVITHGNEVSNMVISTEIGLVLTNDAVTRIKYAVIQNFLTFYTHRNKEGRPL